MRHITIYRILVVVVLLLMVTWQILVPRQRVVYPSIYIEATPIPERTVPGEPIRGWELPVIIY